MNEDARANAAGAQRTGVRVSAAEAPAVTASAPGPAAAPTGFPLAETFSEQFAFLAGHCGERAAVIASDGTLTFAELDARTTRAARLFEQRGVAHGDFVLISTPHCALMVEASIAALKLGAIPMPVSDRLTQAELDGLIALASPVLAVDTTAREVSTPRLRSLDEADSLPADALPAVVGPSLKAPTSGGSTGTPKIIVSTAPGAPEGYCLLGAAMRVPAEGVCLVTAALYHNASFSNALAALVQGSTAVLMDRFDAEEALRLIEARRATWIYMVPTMMLRVWKLPPEVRTGFDLSSLETVLHLAAPCPAWLKREWIDWLGPDVVYEVFGTTEGQAATAISGRDWLERPGSVGRVISGELVIRDETGAEAAPGTVGEVWVRRGAEEPVPYRYLGAEAEVDAAGWETVGDMGWKDEDGFVFLSDRRSDMILVGGVNVYPAEVEAAAEAHPQVLSAGCVGLDDEELGKRPALVVQTASGEVPPDLEDRLAEALARVKRPVRVLAATEPLRDAAGKVRRRALLARFA
ncbi:AMP-binding protein [Brevibacterium album]|uniref:AMP-binding protein n=1 Tax=Brevibacterium album TaxID=417948 RepID=UPI00068670CF|nr:AMP-binding protein [Brevibacterium album]